MHPGISFHLWFRLVIKNTLKYAIATTKYFSAWEGNFSDTIFILKRATRAIAKELAIEIALFMLR